MRPAPEWLEEAIMIKLVYCIRRRAGLGAEEFSRYWLEKHGPLVRSVAAAIGACRYVQSHATSTDMSDMLRASRGASPAFDGITEVWWTDRAALEKGLGEPVGQEAARRLLEDEATFIDLAASSLFLTEEHEIFDLR